jgi:mannose-1-phosphate guanylyltransferase
MLEIWLQRCQQFGIEEILINLHSHGDAVRDFLLSATRTVRVRIVDEPVLLGSAGTIHANRDWVANERNFWVFYADVLTDFDLQEMVLFHEERRTAATIGVYEVPDPSRCGIVQVDSSGIVSDFVEKPAVPIGRLAFAGILLAGPEFIRALPPTSPADIGFNVLPKLVGNMAAYPISSYLLDVGTMTNYQLAQENWPGLVRTGTGEKCFEA